MNRHWLGCVAIVGLATVGGVGCGSDAATDSPPADAPPLDQPGMQPTPQASRYAAEIQPIFEAYCTMCHDGSD